MLHPSMDLITWKCSARSHDHLKVILHPSHGHPQGMLNYDPNSLKVAKLTSEAEARRREAWARTDHGVLVNTPRK
jgi:hypothetical protein